MARAVHLASGTSLLHVGPAAQAEGGEPVLSPPGLLEKLVPGRGEAAPSQVWSWVCGF